MRTDAAHRGLQQRLRWAQHSGTGALSHDNPQVGTVYLAGKRLGMFVHSRDQVALPVITTIGRSSSP
jgi:hypothetical protein